MIESFASSTEDCILSLVVASLAFSIVLNLSMTLIWNLLNVLQIITHLKMFNIPYPSNVSTMFTALVDVANFNLIPREWTDKIFSAIFDNEALNVKSN